MNTSGKTCAVRVDLHERIDSTGLKVGYSDSFTVWADPGLEEAIKSVEGVTKVEASLYLPGSYFVHYDMRYDPEVVARNVKQMLED